MKVNIPKEQLERFIGRGIPAKDIACYYDCSVWTVMKRVQEYGLTFNGAMFFNKGENNPAKRPEVREQISNSVKALWDEGKYNARINGMAEMYGALHPNYNSALHTPEAIAEKDYRGYLAQYEDIYTCRRCGARVGKKMNVHHIDEDHANFLPSNLEPLCVPCHMVFHYNLQKLPFVSISKRFSFAGAHRLPEYKGPCNRWHGHEWGLEVTLRKRIDPATGMVLDFGVLKKLVTGHIIDVFDHQTLNDFIPNPTAENILVWVWEKLMFDAHLKGIQKITLWETPTSEACMTKEDMLSVLKSKLNGGAI